MSKPKIYFVHQGRAAYPEIDAYKRYFPPFYETEAICPKALSQKKDAGDSICWMMMGFYPFRPSVRMLIHDYRSLSVGRARPIKDGLKRFLNAKPDVRLFQNEAMASIMGFRDDVPTVYLPMGVPENVYKLRASKTHAPACDFCYIGVMSQERQTYLMFDSFLRRFGASKTFHVYGEPEPALKQKYAAHDNIVFKGKQPQEHVFQALLKTRVAVNYFPVHLPHALQTPTKLLEYAALGLRILSNEHPQSRLTCKTYGINSQWGAPRDMFAAVPDDLMWADNKSFEPDALLWPNVIKASGVAEVIEKVLKNK